MRRSGCRGRIWAGCWGRAQRCSRRCAVRAHKRHRLRCRFVRIADSRQISIFAAYPPLFWLVRQAGESARACCCRLAKYRLVAWLGGIACFQTASPCNPAAHNAGWARFAKSRQNRARLGDAWLLLARLHRVRICRAWGYARGGFGKWATMRRENPIAAPIGLD